jgi:hypothetical protein
LDECERFSSSLLLDRISGYTVDSGLVGALLGKRR